MNDLASDRQLKHTIDQLLAEAPRIDASRVDVEVGDGNVRISGTVLHPGIRQALMDLVTAVPGVRSIDDQGLRTGHRAPGKVSRTPGYRGRSTVSDPKVSDDDNLVGTPRL